MDFEYSEVLFRTLKVDIDDQFVLRKSKAIISALKNLNDELFKYAVLFVKNNNDEEECLKAINELDDLSYVPDAVSYLNAHIGTANFTLAEITENDYLKKLFNYYIKQIPDNEVFKRIHKLYQAYYLAQIYSLDCDYSSIDYVLQTNKGFQAKYIADIILMNSEADVFKEVMMEILKSEYAYKAEFIVKLCEALPETESRTLITGASILRQSYSYYNAVLVYRALTNFLRLQTTSEECLKRARGFVEKD